MAEATNITTRIMFMGERGVKRASYHGSIIINEEALDKDQWEKVPGRFLTSTVNDGILVDIWEVETKKAHFFCILCGLTVEELRQDIKNILRCSNRNPLVRMHTCLIFPWGLVLNTGSEVSQESVSQKWTERTTTHLCDYLADYDFNEMFRDMPAAPPPTAFTFEEDDDDAYGAPYGTVGKFTRGNNTLNDAKKWHQSMVKSPVRVMTAHLVGKQWEQTIREAGTREDLVQSHAGWEECWNL